MLTLKEQIQNLKTILKQQELSSENRQLLLKEIQSLKKTLIMQNNHSCYQCHQTISQDVYQLESKGVCLSFCQTCAEKGVELNDKLYRLCFTSDCSTNEKIYLTKKK